MWKIAFFHMFHSRAPWTTFQEAFQLCHRLLRSAHEHLHRAVREVPHEPPQFQSAGFMKNEPAKTHTLYSTSDDVARLWHRAVSYPWARRAARRRYHHT